MFKQVESYSNKRYNDTILKIYGISQNPDTNDYIMVLHEYHCEKCDKKYPNLLPFKWCRSCQTSGSEQIDDFIQEKQLKFNWNEDIGFEWIPYNQFDCIKEIGKAGLITVYSAIWKDGPLYYSNCKWKREPGKKVTLKCLHNSQNITNKFLNEV